MGHIRPFSLRPGGIQSVPSNILRSAWWDVLCQLQQETGHGEGFDLSLEEFVVGSVVDHGGLSILLDTYLFQRQRWAGDVLREGFSCLRGSGEDVNRSVDTESGVPPIDQAGSDLTIWIRSNSSVIAAIINQAGGIINTPNFNGPTFNILGSIQ